MTSTLWIVKTFQGKPKWFPGKWVAGALCSQVRPDTLFDEEAYSRHPSKVL